MKKLSFLSSTALFRGMTDQEISAALQLLSCREQAYEKGAFLFTAEVSPPSLSLVLEGNVSIVREDYWGNRSVIGLASAGDIFCESFALAGFSSMPVSVVANSPCRILFLSLPSKGGSLPVAFYRNLLGITSCKNIALTQKIQHMSQKTTREKLLSYLSSQAQAAGSSDFSIPFDRQGLADYLSVDRSALSAQLSSLRREGLLDFHKNHFRLLS